MWHLDIVSQDLNYTCTVKNQNVIYNLTYQSQLRDVHLKQHISGEFEQHHEKTCFLHV